MRAAVVAAALITVCAGAGTAASRFSLASSAFRPGGTIPVRHTCDGANLSPPLRWAAAPPGTRSFALVMDDPDAPRGTFTHWLAWNIPAGSRSLRAGQRPPREGLNDAGGIGYTGPCPPSGTHRYVLRLYALRAPLALPRGASLGELRAALRGNVLASARLIGRYGR